MYTIGCDPEFFVYDNTRHQYISGHDLIPGTKENPFKVNGGAIQVDGVSLEININPAETVEEFVGNIAKVRKTLRTIVSKSVKDFAIDAVSHARFPKEYFDSLPDDAKALGCNPDYNAYTGEQNPTPETTEPFRTGSGHVHVGWRVPDDPNDVTHIERCISVIRQLDAAMYVPSLFFDIDPTRRKLYGKIGAFRPKSYGVEYRSLSSTWLNSPGLQEWVFNTTKAALELLDEDMIIRDALPDRPARILQNAQAGVDPNMGEVMDYYDHVIDLGLPELPGVYTGLRK